MVQPADDGQHVLTNLAAAVNQAAGPLERLVAARELREATEAVQRAAVDEARATRHSWSQVAAALRVSKQSAQRKYSPKPDPVHGPEPVERPARKGRPSGWDITTPKGRRLLRVVKTR